MPSNKSKKKVNNPRERKKRQLDYDLITKMAARGLTKQQLAHNLGMSRSMLYKQMSEDPKIKEHYDRGRAMGIKQVANALFVSAVDKKNVSAQIFYLKVVAKWREPKDKSDKMATGNIVYCDLPDNGR